MGSTTKILSDDPAEEVYANSSKILMHEACYHAVYLVGIRGRNKAAGDPGKNDVGMYDDAIFLCHPEGFTEFQANVDPSKLTPGIATLVPGVWFFKLGTHGLSKPPHLRYEALVQAAQVSVKRTGGVEDRGWFGVNIHRGGQNTTGSAGCQTLPPALWPAFIRDTKRLLDKHGQKVVPYLLVDNG